LVDAVNNNEIVAGTLHFGELDFHAAIIGQISPIGSKAARLLMIFSTIP
jgi:hypothetical protein